MPGTKAFVVKDSHELAHFLKTHCIETLWAQYSTFDGQTREEQVVMTGRTPEEVAEFVYNQNLGVDGSSVGFQKVNSTGLRLAAEENARIGITEKETAVIQVGSFLENGEPFLNDPARINHKAQQALKDKHGITINVGLELEGFLLKDGKRLNQDRSNTAYHGRHTLDPQMAKFQQEVATRLVKSGINCQFTHNEVATDQFELGVLFETAEEKSRTIMLQRQICEQVASEMGLEVDFTPKPFDGINGSGMHYNFSIQDAEGNNLFKKDKDKDGLNKFSRQIGFSVLEHIQMLQAFANPVYDSHKRLVEGMEAPVAGVMGPSNRSCAIRIVGDGNSSRLELRFPDPMANTQLLSAAIAMVVGEAMDKIKQGIIANPPVTDEDVFEMDEAKKKELGVVQMATGENALATALTSLLSEKSTELLTQGGVFDESFFDSYAKERTAAWEKDKAQAQKQEAAEPDTDLTEARLRVLTLSNAALSEQVTSQAAEIKSLKQQVGMILELNQEFRGLLDSIKDNLEQNLRAA